MEVKWLEDFIALAHNKSFSRAAQVRSITQSGFSRRIRGLEEWVGAELVDRSSFPPTLTVAGRQFLEVAEDVTQKLLEARTAIRMEQGMRGSGLKIAAGHTIALSFVPAWLNTLTDSIADLRARVTPTNVHDSVLMLINGNCELMFAYQHPDLPMNLDPSRYEHVTVGADVLMPVCRSKAGGAPRFRLPGSARQPVPYISYAETTYFGRCVALLLARSTDPGYLMPRFESDMADVLKRMVLEGEGVAWLPKSLITAELASGALASAGGDEWSVPLGLNVYRDSMNRDALLTRVWAHLKSTVPAPQPYARFASGHARAES
jgi:DNA-binding transcriptional LysR family regulator